MISAQGVRNYGWVELSRPGQNKSQYEIFKCLLDSPIPTVRKTFVSLTSGLRLSLATRSPENSTPTAVVVEDDEVGDHGGGQS